MNTQQFMDGKEKEAVKSFYSDLASFEKALGLKEGELAKLFSNSAKFEQFISSNSAKLVGIFGTGKNARAVLLALSDMVRDIDMKIKKQNHSDVGDITDKTILSRVGDINSATGILSNLAMRFKDKGAQYTISDIADELNELGYLKNGDFLGLDVIPFQRRGSEDPVARQSMMASDMLFKHIAAFCGVSFQELYNIASDEKRFKDFLDNDVKKRHSHLEKRIDSVLELIHSTYYAAEKQNAQYYKTGKAEDLSGLLATLELAINTNVLSSKNVSDPAAVGASSSSLSKMVRTGTFAVLLEAAKASSALAAGKVDVARKIISTAGYQKEWDTAYATFKSNPNAIFEVHGGIMRDQAVLENLYTQISQSRTEKAAATEFVVKADEKREKTISQSSEMRKETEEQEIAKGKKPSGKKPKNIAEEEIDESENA